MNFSTEKNGHKKGPGQVGAFSEIRLLNLRGARDDLYIQFVPAQL